MTRPRAAMIFAAGFGTRMGDVTRHTPKPMLPLRGRPMIDHTIGILKEAGLTRIVANTHHLHDRIAPHLEASGVVISREDPQILETGGGLKAALPLLGPGPVMTANSDAIWIGRNPAATLIKAWKADMNALLLVSPAAGARGDFGLNGGRLERRGDYVYTGLQIIRTDRLDEIGDEVFSLNRYWDLLAEDGGLHGVVYDGVFCEAGDAAGLAKAERLLSNV
ncbi:nucleotidyltransferase family protein [Silicimonas algicola]|uniref:MurNAc alpha-1-phosphate uridylyltransferase n=1 Tax=Silicimonas algicola TaxID=1826607 RepID=A0A316G8K5_9RHOB|nr:nucleotidyltransferase family protein [Silicimonas algicola]AZQ69466.1 nucleotidyltransferase family protein [Silicimonas algicola]PWK56535.1 MurNAc alpha-1-phosphate uridylyltransferase [Silicimonas algicola]